MILIEEVLQHIKTGVTVRECALRFAISARTVYRCKKSGTKGGRPRALTDEEVHAAFNAWWNNEADMYALAGIYRCSVQTIRNYMLAELAKCG